MFRSLFEPGYDGLYFLKCGGVSLRQIRCDLIASCQDVMKQVTDCGILRAAYNSLSLIKKLFRVFSRLSVVLLHGLQIHHRDPVAKLRQLFAGLTEC
jgi:hypothetical protein